MKKIVLLAVGVAAMAWSCVAQPANLSPGLQEIVKLTQAHMSDDVIVAYIKNSGAAFTLSADDILYLNSQGVSQPVLSELLKSKPSAPTPLPTAGPTPSPTPVTTQAPAAGAAPATTAATTPAPPAQPPMVPPPIVGADGTVAQPSTPPPPVAGSPSAPPPDSEVNLAYFQGQLGTAGVWIDVPGYGQCWQPAVAAQNVAWRPYFDSGHWVYTDDGWTWQSDYAWGEIAFHYGRWFHDWHYGWVWLPGYNWGPAWVSWRHAEGEGFCGWAPLPPEARFEVGVGLTFGGRVGVDLDFGLQPTAFVFVPFDHFWAPDYHVWVAPPSRVDVLFHVSVVANGYTFVGGRFIVEGLGRDRIAVLTHHPVPVERVVIRDERIARAREFQHVRSEEVRHVIGHDDAMRREADVRHDVRQVEAAHHEEAVHRFDAGHQPSRGVPGASHGQGQGPRDGDRNRDGQPK
jgi:hypothetical protein